MRLQPKRRQKVDASYARAMDSLFAADAACQSSVGADPPSETGGVYSFDAANFSPQPPVDWRWRRALAIAKGGPRYAEDAGDVVLEQATRYLSATRDRRTEADQQHVEHAWPYHHAARRLHERADKLTRGLLEARILAEQPDDEIAVACNLDVETVRVYEALFFDVRHRLRHWMFIVSHAIGPKCWSGLTEADVDVIVKRLGFLRGPMMVDMLQRYYASAWETPTTFAGMTHAQMSELATMLHIKALIWAMVLPFEQTRKITRLQGLIHEMRALIETMPQPRLTAAPASSAAGPRLADTQPAQPGTQGELAIDCEAAA